MLFSRLLESHRLAAETRAIAQGFLISAAAHVVLVGGSVIATHRSEAAPEPSETFTPVEYLVPKEKLAGMRPQQEKITWTTLAAGEGSGFRAEAAEPPRDEEKLEVVVAKGDSAEIDAAREDLVAQPPIALGDSIMTELQVDSAVVRYENSAAPPYPESMLRRRIEGVVLVQYVVDTLGRADTLSFRVLSATHADFARAVRNTLPFMRFRPAIMANHRVSQLVQQPFAFKIVDTVATQATSDRTRKPPER
jgi:TonB family protein